MKTKPAPKRRPGRPRNPEALKSTPIYLTAKQIDACVGAGDGNRSAGARRLLDIAIETTENKA